MPMKACIRCRQRKVKCVRNDGQLDCNLCIKHNVNCIIGNDGRTLRVSSKIVLDLKQKIKELEDKKLSVSKYCYGNGNGIFMGYEKERERERDSTTDDIDNNNWINLRDNEDIINSMKTFFKWMYPDLHVFLTRETFLVDFFKGYGDYCSKSLIYAVCALGKLYSDGIESKKCKEYYMESYKRINGKINIPMVQSLLLLGLFDIHTGNIENSWSNIGRGLRECIAIGLNREESNNNNNNNNHINNHTLIDDRDEEINKLFRRRVYWGCYMIDHFISHITGRVCMLQRNDSLINESDCVPDLEGIEEFNFGGILDISSPLRAIIKLIDIIKYNNDLKLIENWRNNLDNDLKWDKENIKIKSLNPPQMIHIYYYYMILGNKMNNLQLIELSNGVESFLKNYREPHISLLMIASVSEGIKINNNDNRIHKIFKDLLNLSSNSCLISKDIVNKIDEDKSQLPIPSTSSTSLSLSNMPNLPDVQVEDIIEMDFNKLNELFAAFDSAW
ncbi:hypothetical protein DAPK24_017060 [Pichia kluyveri]|uniref:Zn(2)-C6 fungal-type domain-containing protein n=1 Tax=Pichia kluyveri TaxID=36015 RepID=A0AAV5R3D4_PICKL|nr:hypothetical protein DAPK24_017060 [Pichia kluyveri]